MGAQRFFFLSSTALHAKVTSKSPILYCCQCQRLQQTIADLVCRIRYQRCRVEYFVQFQRSALVVAAFLYCRSSSRRGHPLKIFLPQSNLEIKKRSFFLLVVDDWNSLLADTVMSQSLQSFKHSLWRDLGQRLFNYSRDLYNELFSHRSFLMNPP